MTRKKAFAVSNNPQTHDRHVLVSAIDVLARLLVANPHNVVMRENCNQSIKAIERELCATDRAASN